MFNVLTFKIYDEEIHTKYYSERNKVVVENFKFVFYAKLYELVFLIYRT